MSVIALFLLSSLGIAMTVQAQDCSKPEGGPNMNLRDTDIVLESFPNGTKAIFTCDVGYRSAGGSASVTCTGGTWSPVLLTCEIKNCGSAGEVDNGFVDYPNGTEFGALAVVTCRTGYKIAGRGRYICGDQGWLGKLQSCEVTTCYLPDGLQGVSFSPTKEYYEFREVVSFSCPKDLFLSGSSSLTCSEDGTFKPDPPTCIKVECQDPDSPVRNTEWASGARPPYKHNAVVTLQCKSGYSMRGLATVTCGINNEWSPQPPVCERTVPPVPPKPPTKPPTKPTTTTTTSPPSTKGPTDEGNELPKILGIVFGVISFAVLVCCGCYWCGVPAFLKKKRGTRGANTDKEAPHDGEAVALSYAQ